MSKLIFRLNGVDEEEAQDVRDLFELHHIDYYETDAGRWGLSVAALWLINPKQLSCAQELLADYQQQRLLRIRESRAQNEDLYKPLSVKERFLQSPFQYLLLVIAIVAVVGFSTLPFVSLY
jgi:hypothetical protein